MGRRQDKQEALAEISVYYEEQLASLISTAGDVIELHRAGELDTFQTDKLLAQYSRAAKELWKFCHHGPVALVVSTIRRDPPSDWWERGVFRGPRGQ